MKKTSGQFVIYIISSFSFVFFSHLSRFSVSLFEWYDFLYGIRLHSGSVSTSFFLFTSSTSALLWHDNCCAMTGTHTHKTKISSFHNACNFEDANGKFSCTTNFEMTMPHKHISHFPCTIFYIKMRIMISIKIWSVFW